MVKKHSQQRKIRSYVKREGRLTLGQKTALIELLPQFGIDHLQGRLNFKQLFARNAKTVLEIGFGMGHSLLQQAALNPQLNYLGIEVHRPGVGALLKGMKASGLGNLRVSTEDAIEVLEDKIVEQSLTGVQLFFPDPWQKRRHHKRRMVNATFVKVILKKLQGGGFFHLATDWKDYAQQMLEVLMAESGFSNVAEDGGYISRPDNRPLTKFELRGNKLGHAVWDLMFIRN